MAATRLHVDIEKRLATFDLHIQLDVGTEILVLYGPSGAGKTQTLNMIAGLAMPDAGEVGLDGVPYFRRGRPGPKVVLAARRRRIGYVFQQYALFPHLNALDNVAYPLWRQRDARTRAWALLERMHLEHVAGHYPHELSGGQQQRVAIARALAVEPRVLLLDEPFSALDLAIRERLHQDLHTVQAEEGLVVIYITHNLEDAFAVGHRLAVVRDGRVEQVGPLEMVMRTPTSPAVLQILGIPNVLQARVVQSTPLGIVLDWDGLRLEAPPQTVQEGAQVMAYIRPEDIKILYPDRPLASAVRHNQVVGRITRMQHGPSFLTIVVELTNGRNVEVTFPAYTYRPLALAIGSEVQLSLRKDGLMLLPARDVARRADSFHSRDQSA